MREISKEELAEVIRKHELWLEGDGGERANLRYVNLRYVNLRSADLRSADLRSADLRSADLCYADLRSADLRSADLRSADLRYVKGQHFITQRKDGHQFFLVQTNNGRWMIRAGCQYKSISDYRKHTESYENESKKIETNLILDFAEAILNKLER